MPRFRSIQVSALNITTHPHSPEKYIQLFQDVFEAARPARFRSNHYGMIGSLHFLDENNPLEGIHGEIYKFLDFNADEPWLNLAEHKKADEHDLRQVNIPDHLKPDFASARYIFLPRSHKLFFESKTADSKSFGPTTMQKIFTGIFSLKSIRELYGEVDVTIEPSREGLKNIFSIHTLKRLQIVLQRPNPDDLEETEKEVLERLNQQNAKKMESLLIADSGQSLAPDKGTQTLAKIAASNGHVSGEGKDEEGMRIEESTADHPWHHVIKFNPKTQGAREAFLGQVADMSQKLRRRFRG